MALTNCRECGKNVSTDAASCPNCGTPWPARPAGAAPQAGAAAPAPASRSRRTPLWKLVVAGFVLLVLGLAIRDAMSASSGAAPAAEVASAPAMSRAEAEDVWKTAQESGLIQKVECGEAALGDCRLQVVPSLWAQLPYDSKRDIVTGVGQALNTLQGAPHTNFIDAYSGKDLAVYLARTNTAQIE